MYEFLIATVVNVYFVQNLTFGWLKDTVWKACFLTELNHVFRWRWTLWGQRIMGLGSCLCSDFSFSLGFQLLLASLTLYPHPTFAPSPGQSTNIARCFLPPKDTQPIHHTYSTTVLQPSKIIFFLTLCWTKVPWIWCIRLWTHHICKVCYSGRFKFGLDYNRFPYYPTPRIALSVRLFVRIPQFLPHLTRTHTNLLCERAR